jgi:hypothetical protein
MEKLNEIQQKLNAPKSRKNTFGNYNYRSCEDILEAVKPLLGKAVLTLSDDIVSEGGRVYVRATVTLREGTESVTVTAFAREPETKKGMDESQITGAASSYARKYALNGLFAIDDTKDADATNDHKSLPAPTAAQWDAIMKRAQQNPADRKAVLESAKQHYTLNTHQISTLS